SRNVARPALNQRKSLRFQSMGLLAGRRGVTARWRGLAVIATLARKRRRCAKCKKHYDPGVDEELQSLGDLPVEASLKVVCPACGQWLRLPEKEPIPAPAAPPEILREMMSHSRLVDDVEDSSSSRATRTSSQQNKPWWKFW